jgi:hypothetical protein
VFIRSLDRLKSLLKPLGSYRSLRVCHRIKGLTIVLVCNKGPSSRDNLIKAVALLDKSLSSSILLASLSITCRYPFSTSKDSILIT